MTMEYLRRNFGPNSISAEKAMGEFQLLLFNGHSSHVNIKFLDYCIAYQKIPFSLPPHKTHRSEPLNVSIFSPYKHQYQRELTRRFERHDYGVLKQNFYQIRMTTHHASLIPTNIHSRFLNTGLVSVNRNIIISKIQALQSHSSIHNSTVPNSTVPNLHQTQSPSQLPDLEPLNPFSAQQIHSLTVPQNKFEIERQELIGLATLPTNNMKEWELKKIISTLGVTGNPALTEVDKKQRLIENLKQQLAEMHHKRVINQT